MSSSVDEIRSAARLSPDEDEISLLDLVVVLAENIRLLVFGSLAAGMAALGIAFLITPTFTATTKILPPQQQQSASSLLASQLGALSGLAGAAGLNLKNPSDLYVAIIKSRTIADRMVDRFKLLEIYGEKFRQHARKKLAGATNVSAGKDGLITIEVDDDDPKRAADMANAYVEELTRLNDGLAITEAQQRRAFFEKQLRTTSDSLKSTQLALGETGVPETLIKSSPEAVVAGIAQLKARISAQEVKVSTMRAYLTEQAPELQLASSELASLQAQLTQVEKDQPAKGSQRRAEYLNRFRDFKYQETLFELLAKQYEAARLDESREGSLQVVDVAVPPELKSKPKKALIAVLTTLAAGALLTLYVFLRESMRSARHDADSASKLARIASGFSRFIPGRKH